MIKALVEKGKFSEEKALAIVEELATINLYGATNICREIRNMGEVLKRDIDPQEEEILRAITEDRLDKENWQKLTKNSMKMCRQMCTVNRLKQPEVIWDMKEPITERPGKTKRRTGKEDGDNDRCPKK